MSDVHTEHCCGQCLRCKYSDEYCSVVKGYAPSNYICEYCQEFADKQQPLENILNHHLENASSDSHDSNIHMRAIAIAKIELLKTIRQDFIHAGFIFEAPKFKQYKTNANLVKLSKFMSKILRHEPEKFGLKLDQDGFVLIKDLVRVLSESILFKWTEDDMRMVVANCEKQRFHIAVDKIRARYGHSVDETIKYPEVNPPEFLYHGTGDHSVKNILKEGLRSMNRQYVHLSPDMKTARSVGSRHSHSPVIFSIEAKKARAGGIKFYDASDATGKAKTYLVKYMPAEFISILNTEDNDVLY